MAVIWTPMLMEMVLAVEKVIVKESGDGRVLELASQLCQDLNLGGKTDWYLSSKYELNLMYENIGQGNVLGLGNVGNFANYYYWSSTELDDDVRVDQDFDDGYQSYNDKDDTYFVRAVRAF